MAVEIGTATDHVDLYNKLYTFLTSNADLVAAGQEWSQVWAAPNAAYPFTADMENSAVMLSGPGAAGNDQIYVGMRLAADATNDVYGLWFSGATGVVASSDSYASHVNSAPAQHMPVFDQATPYWFVASGRRFIVVAKISTTFVAAYQGFFLPYATPSEYPYPMVCGACGRTSRRWSDESVQHTHFCMPFEDDVSYYAYDDVTTAEDGRLPVMSPSGEWVRFNNRRDPYTVFPWKGPSAAVDFVDSQIGLIGGGHMLYPATLVSTGSRVKGTLGVLDGVFHVSGFGNAAENIITVDGIDHLVVQNLFRTGFTDYWALRLT